MRDDPTVVALVRRARDGDRGAWDDIVARYAPLVWSVCRRFGLDRADVDDVGQSVWLRLVERLGDLRDPAALPGWIATTTRHECSRVLRAGRRHERLGAAVDSEATADDAPPVDHDLLLAERDAALRAAFAQLPERCQALLRELMRDPPAPYAEISQRLRIPVGAIGPNRARCLERLRRCPALAALTGAAAVPATAGGPVRGGGTRGDAALGR
ncbi:MAG TPA: sigma-70 family RNA polymerase sigma factor [Pilimelia sp.]|nr:sigma-70 family RNA polymerase sigma factor [Pilimelia sp.]